MSYLSGYYFPGWYFAQSYFSVGTTGATQPGPQSSPYFTPLYFPSPYFAPSYFGYGNLIVFENIFQAVRYRSIQAVPSLNGFFFEYPPPRPRLPYCIYNTISSSPDYTIEENYWEYQRIQFTVRAESLSTASAVGHCIRNALGPKVLRLIPKFSDGYIFGCIPGDWQTIGDQSPSQKYGKNGSFIFDITFMVGRTLITDDS